MNRLPTGSVGIMGPRQVRSLAAPCPLVTPSQTPVAILQSPAPLRPTYNHPDGLGGPNRPVETSKNDDPGLAARRARMLCRGIALRAGRAHSHLGDPEQSRDPCFLPRHGVSSRLAY